MSTRREQPIVDAHHHLWDLERNYLPWLKDEPPIAFRYGDYRALRRSYLPADYARDTAGFRIVGSVYVETEWDRRDPVGETRWIHEIADAAGRPDVVVAHARLDDPEVEAVLAAHCRFPRVRGIRHKPTAASHPDAVRPGIPGSMSDPAWQRGFALLAGYGLSFDLQTPWWHLDEAYALAMDHPATTIVLNHTGLPADRSAAGLAGWRRAMAQLARAPNVAVKISGLGLPGQAWTAAINGPVVLETIDLFGVDRCLFASNFPVDSLVASFAEIYDGFLEIAETYRDEDRAKLFADNARRVYRMG